MNRKKSVLLAVVAGMISTTAFVAQAQETMEKKPAEVPKFEKVDKNADGAISTGEAKGTWLATVFTKVDTNKDGYITKSEYENASR